MKRLSTIFPLLADLKSYNKSFFSNDLVAGLTVGIMLVPQGMAYASLAGLPAIYGLYGGLVPLIIYALLGTSRQLSIGPVAISALLVLEGVSRLAEPMSVEYIQLVILAGLLIGLLQIILGVLRLGILVNFISHPVIQGFTSAAGIIIIVSQLKDVLGFEFPANLSSAQIVKHAFENISQTHQPTLLMCLASIILIFLLKKINKNIPGSLLVVVLGTLLTALNQWDGLGLEIVGKAPIGLPLFEFPLINKELIQKLMPTVLTVTLIGIVESLSIAKLLDAKHKYYYLKPNQELLALGFSKIGGAFFQSLPTSGSFTRSAINNENKGRTGISSLITAILIVLTLLFLTPLFFYLPKAVLAAIILIAVRSLFDYKEAIFLWKTHKKDFSTMLFTFIITLVLGIEQGVLAGVILSIILLLHKSVRPHTAVLGKLPHANVYRNIERFDATQNESDQLIFRFDEKLYFANAGFFKEEMIDIIDKSPTKINHFLLDAKSIIDIDSTGIHALKEVVEIMKSREIEFYLCGATGPIRDILKKSGLYEAIGRKNHFLTVDQAVQSLKKS